MTRGLRGSRQLLVGWPARIFRATLFNLAVLAGLTAAYLIVLASAPRIPHLLSRSAHDSVALVLALSLIVATILIAVEAVYSYAVLGSYGQSFHELRPERRQPDRILVREFQVFAGALIAAHLAGVGAMYFIGHRFGGYTKIAMPTPDPAQAALQTLDCSYYTLATFAGAGDPEPLTAAGKVASGLVAVQGLAFLVLVLASMLSIVGNERAGFVRTSATVQPATGIAQDSTEYPGAHRDVRCHHTDASEPKPSRARSFALGAAAGAVGVVAVLTWTRVRRTRRHHAR